MELKGDETEVIASSLAPEARRELQWSSNARPRALSFDAVFRFGEAFREASAGDAVAVFRECANLFLS